MPEIIKKDEICFEYTESYYCPKCESYFQGTYYLDRQFGKYPKTRWLANLITHYRHEHTNWDKNKYVLLPNSRKPQGQDYEKDKAAINEYIKQWLIRKHHNLLKENKITEQIFKNLKGTKPETIRLYKKTINAVS